MKNFKFIIVAAILAVASLVASAPAGGFGQVGMGHVAVAKTPPRKTPPKKAPPKAAPTPAMGTVAANSLPAQAKSVLATLKSGRKVSQGFKQDGTVFQNRENRLPAQTDKSYYSEYTVVTPGAKTRGARRIIKGKGGLYYYTADHYKTFKRIQ